MDDAKPPYHFLIPAQDFIDGPGVSWLVEELLPTKGLAFLYAQPKHFKTFIALGFARAVLSGEPFCGFETKEKGSVIYFALEGRGGARQRVEAVMQNLQLRPDEKQAFHAIEYPFRMPQVSEKEWPLLLKDLDAFEKAHGPIKLIIIDTFAQFSEAEENNSTAVSGVLRVLHELSNATGALVMLVHHANKPTKKGGKGRGIRGSSALVGAADTIIAVERSEGSLFCKMECEKQKDFDEFEAFGVELEQVALRGKVTLRVKGRVNLKYVALGCKTTDGGKRSAPKREMARAELLKLLAKKSVTHGEAKAAVVPDLASEGTFANVWNELRDNGEIVEESEGQWIAKPA